MMGPSSTEAAMKKKLNKVVPRISVNLTTILDNFGNPPVENTALQYWKVYFDFGYLFLFIPFRFRFNSDTGSYEIHTNIFQKILALLGAMLASSYFLLNVRQKWIDTNRNPSHYFEIASYFFDTFFLMPMFLTFGRQADTINLIFQEVQHSQFARPQAFTNNSNGIRKTKWIAYSLCLLCLAHPMVYLLEIFLEFNWSLTAVAWKFAKDGQRVFKVLIPTKTKSLSLLACFALLSLFSNLVDKLINTYGDILFLVTVLMFRQLVSYFRQSLSDRTYVSPNQVLKHYKWLKGVTERINSGMGIITLSFILGNLPFFATSILSIFFEGSNFERAINFTVCVYFFGALYLAAKACRDVGEIREWLWKEENYARIHPVKLNVLLQETTTAQPVAISAYGCITVNYGTVGSIVSVIFTYALLKQQFQGQP